MKITQIQPSRVPPTQCSVTVYDMTSPPTQFYTEYRKGKAGKRGYDLERCQKSSKYLIDGEGYCAFHAGIKALEILMAQSADVSVWSS